jgi:hypothetical protein
MQSSAPIRLIAAASFAISASLSTQPTAFAQARPRAIAPSASGLPATPPTTSTPPITPAPSTPSQLPPHVARVTYTDGTLSISADNSSLNQILREISHETGIKISGGVTDERVFGQYGPETPAQVLATLLDGTGSNMLLVHSDGDTPAQLILTPRQGGPTPPNPNAAVFDNRSATETPAPSPQPAEPDPAKAEQRVPPPDPPVTPVTPATGASPSSDPSQPDSPNGVKTPQQIYDQLQRLHQQQTQPQTPQ